MARILIADDNAAVRTVLRAILDRAGHDTFLAECGEEALREICERPLDLVITDLQMPGVHGLELITRVRDLAPPLAIIAISGTGVAQLDRPRP